jgi:hypothetical protein
MVGGTQYFGDDIHIWVAIFMGEKESMVIEGTMGTAISRTDLWLSVVCKAYALRASASKHPEEPFWWVAKSSYPIGSQSESNKGLDNYSGFACAPAA